MKFKEAKLSDIANITMGQSPTSNFFNENGIGIEFLQGVRTFGDVYPTYDTYTTQFNRKAEKGAILFSVRAPVGKVNIANKDIAIGRGLAAIYAKNIDKNFLFYALKKVGDLADSQANGTVFSSINKKEIDNLVVMIPESITIQQQIGHILNVLDEKIAVNKQINDNLAA